MTDAHDPTAAHATAPTQPGGLAATPDADEIRDPANHVVGVLDAAHTRAAREAREAGGCLASELPVRGGPGYVEPLGAPTGPTGRTGLVDRVRRCVERLGVHQHHG